MRRLHAQPLSAAVIAPFGSVIESMPEGAPVNGGTSRRHEAVLEWRAEAVDRDEVTLDEAVLLEL